MLINGEGTNSLGLENVIRDNFVPRTLFPAPWGRGWIRHIGHRPRGIMKPRENPLMVAIRYSFRYCFALRVMRQPWRRGWRVTKCNSPHYAIVCKIGSWHVLNYCMTRFWREMVLAICFLAGNRKSRINLTMRGHLFVGNSRTSPNSSSPMTGAFSFNASAKKVNLTLPEANETA